MDLVEFVPPTPHPLWKLCPQMGITDVVVKVNPDLTGLSDPWRLSTLRSIVERLKVEGLNVVGLEGDPFDMTPIKEYDSRKEQGGAPSRCAMSNGGAGSSTSLGLSREERKYTSAALRLCVKNKFDISREEALSHYRELLESMGKLGIKLLCYNFMVGKGWSRTGVREGRGGAKATYFSLAETKKTSDSGHRTSSAEVGSPKSEVLKLTADQVWANYEYFIKSVMPTAEKCGVRMALHPDDPCLNSLGGYARIFGSVEAYDRAYALYPSPSNAVTFCQANFKLMLGNGERGTVLATKNAKSTKTLRPLRPLRQKIETLEDVARHFGKRIAFIHVRDVEGTKEDFTELFHDQGTTDQFALMRVYRELELDVPVRGDHVPEMAYDRVLTPEGTPGYFTLGRLFANGYLKALLQAAGTVSV
ncbi:MAG: mannonate dehydratase [Kiritimatiellae bacterium]|nr:mannonate dehydratase [Kiritimatiellia bacterium]